MKAFLKNVLILKTGIHFVVLAFLFCGINSFAQTTGLKDINSSMKVGWCATDGSKTFFSSPAVKALTLANCNSTNVQCYAAWGRWDEKTMNVFHLDAFNNQVKELKANKMFVTAHMLLGWDQYFPNWYINGDFRADTVEMMMDKWIEGIITFKGNDTLVDNWNVVNEAINWDGKGGYWPVSGTLKNSCEFERMGFEPDASGLPANMIANAEHPVYIRKAFVEARKFTTKDLELRESSFEFPTDQKYKAFYQLVVHLLNSGTPLDAIGFQTHLDLEKNYDWDGYSKNIRRYRDLGLKVNVSEVDVGDIAKSWTDDKAQLQKMVYYQLVTAAIRGGANQFETWGFIDENNAGWRPGTKAWLYTSALAPKPAYFGIKEALTDMSQFLFWEMDAASDTIMQDVAFNNPGTMKNFSTPVFAAGFINKSLQFDGVDDYILADTLSETISDDFAYTCMIKTSGTGPCIIAEIAGQADVGIKLGMDGDGRLTANAEGLSKTLLSGESINNNEWHFVALKRKGDKLKLFLDSIMPVDSCTGSAGEYTRLVAGADFSVAENYNGLIDEVRLYGWAVDDSSFLRNLIPFQPKALSLVKFTNYIKVLWTDQSHNEEGFILQKKTADGSWETVDSTAINERITYDRQYQVLTSYTYRVLAYNRFGESACAITKTITSPAVGIEENEAGKNGTFLIYPNPATDNFVVKSNFDGELSVFSAQGSILGKSKVFAGENNLNTSDLSDGIYIFQISGKDRTQTTKLAVKR
jgi:endo-1,4-beta-xylanase